MNRKWLIVTAAAAALGLAGMTGGALAANTAACAGCHGANGEGKNGNPKIAGMSKSEFVSDMNEFKDGSKKNPAMNAIAKRLSSGEISELADYYASK